MRIYVEEAVFSLLPRFTLFCLQADVGSFRPGKRNPGGDLKTAIESVKGREKRKRASPSQIPWSLGGGHLKNLRQTRELAAS